jgi:dethiobiotin synthetase
MPHKGFFVTGTDTEVGKTLVTAVLIQELQQKNFKTVGYKPVVAGMQIRDSKLINEDIETLLSVSKKSNPQLIDQDLCSYFLNDAAAPHLVAKREGITLNLTRMVDHFHRLADQYDAVVVEGAGGFLVPINETQTLADFAVKINLPVILVVNIRLGCINHALLTALVIQSRGLHLAGWVANCSNAQNAYTLENISSITELLLSQFHCVHLGTIPKISAPIVDGIYSMESIHQASLSISLPL